MAPRESPVFSSAFGLLSGAMKPATALKYLEQSAAAAATAARERLQKAVKDGKIKLLQGGASGSTTRGPGQLSAEGRAGGSVVSIPGKNGSVELLQASAEGSASLRKDGMDLAGRAEANLVHARGSRSFMGFVQTSGSADLLHAGADGALRLRDYGASMTGNAGAAVLQGEGAVGFGGDKVNPYVRVEGGGSVLSAHAKADVLVGDDGKRVGLSGHVGADAQLAEGRVGGEYNIPIPFFPDKSITIRTGLSGSAGGAGGAVGGHAYYDREEGRVHVGGEGEAELLLGAGWDVDISFGNKPKQRSK